MLDINKALSDPLHYEYDPEGNLSELPKWSPLVANQLAVLEDLQLSDEHWEVIYHLRERFRVRGNQDSARDVLHDLEKHFCDNHGRAYLYQLFPRGPVTQASRLAGLPFPPHTHDLSFGSAM
jgi:TusE/DsrC/DsvC family sulfur relay protein